MSDPACCYRPWVDLRPVGVGDASTVAISFPHGTGSVRMPVGGAGFVAKIPGRAMRTMMTGDTTGPGVDR
jgi:hypothetical protein